MGDIHICKNSAVSLTPLSQNHLFFCFCEVVSQKLWFCFFMIKTYLDHWAYFLLIWWDSRFPRNYLAILYLRKQIKLTPQCHWQSNFFLSWTLIQKSWWGHIPTMGLKNKVLKSLTFESNIRKIETIFETTSACQSGALHC